mgnify:CR=1 FL=1
MAATNPKSIPEDPTWPPQDPHTLFRFNNRRFQIRISDFAIPALHVTLRVSHFTIAVLFCILHSRIRYSHLHFTIHFFTITITIFYILI